MEALLIVIGVIALALVAFYAGLYAEGKKSEKGEKVTKDTVAATAWGVFLGVGLIVILIIHGLK